MRVVPAALWTVVLAALPWWIGLCLLVLLTLGAVIFDRRIVQLAERCRRGLRWGLPGLLFAVQRALGGDLLAWGAALLGALVGFSLVALLESLLDHRVRHKAHAQPSPEWSELALAPVGPAAHIIELSLASWRDVDSDFTDPAGDAVRYEAIGNGVGRYVFATGKIIERVSQRCCFGPGGRWFVASLPGGRGDVLWDRQSHRLHRLPGWELAGWEGEQPWMARRRDGVPTALHEVLGQGRRR